jgi:hypothetical protein
MSEASKPSRLLRGGVMTDSIQGKARRLLTDGQILLGIAGPKMEAAGSAPPGQPVPPPHVAAAFAPRQEEDKADAWEAVIVMTALAFIAFDFSGFWFIRCFELPPPSHSRIPGGLLAFEIMAYGICGLGVLCSAVCLVICALKICLRVIRQ